MNSIFYHACFGTSWVYFVAFLHDGKSLYTGSWEYRLFAVPRDLPDEVERMAAWVEVITGLALDKQEGQIQVLDNAAWLAHHEQLMQWGGPPETGPDQRLDPILFGPDPTARAKIFMERKQWDAVEAAFDEAMRARPFNISIAVERGNLYARRGLWSEAAAFYARAVQQYPDIATLRYCHVLSLLSLGDEADLRQACSDLLDHFGTSTDHHIANDVAWACLLAPGAVADRAAPVRLAQFAVNDAPEAEKPDFLNTLGAALLPRRPVRRSDSPPPGRHPEARWCESTSGLGVPGDGSPSARARRRGPRLARSATGSPGIHKASGF